MKRRRRNQNGGKKMAGYRQERPVIVRDAPPQEIARQRAALVRAMRQTHTLQQIADTLGVDRSRVWQICQQYGIPGPSKRLYKPRPKRTTRRQRGGYYLPKVDAAKAEQITASIRAYWQRSA